MQNDKPLNCPFCDKKLKRFKGGYEHKSSQCVLSSLILTDVEIPKWNTRKPMERIVGKITLLERKQKKIMRETGVNSEVFETIRVDEYVKLDEVLDIVKGGADNGKID